MDLHEYEEALDEMASVDPAKDRAAADAIVAAAAKASAPRARSSPSHRALGYSHLVIRSLGPAVLVLVMATATAAADPVQTYAYISDVSVRSSGGNDFIKYHCAFTVQVPRLRLERAPTGAQVVETKHDAAQSE